MSRQPILLLCLEGLSHQQADLLFTSLQSLHVLQDRADPVPLNSSGSASYNAAWSEILWGASWSQTGAFGHGMPHESLNDIAPLKESDIPILCPLLASDSTTVIANVPMIEPGDTQERKWLADGSLPFAFSVSPPQLASAHPFNVYQPRALSCIVYGLADVTGTIARCLDVELNRMLCIEQLLDNDQWDTAIVRLTIFEQLLHLLGDDLFLSQDIRSRSLITAFLSKLDNWLGSLLERHQRAFTCIISAGTHVKCLARVNLNEILRRGGFCKLTRNANKQQSQSIARRKTAVGSITGSQRMDEIPLVTPHWNFDLAASTCGSTAAGAIYLNRSDRFQGGTVSLDEVPRLIEQITDWVETFLQRELGCRPRTLRTQDKNVRCPDIVVLAEGVEFHNSSTHVAVDTSNKPSLTHGGPGFAWLQSRAISGNKLTSLELHKILVGARNA